MTLSTRRLLTAACVAIALTIGFFAAYRLALNELRVQVLNALGPDAEIGDIDLSFRAIQISALKLKSPAGWPAKYALSADADQDYPQSHQFVHRYHRHIADQSRTRDTRGSAGS